MKDKIETIGVYCVCNTMGICVHEIDYCEDRVLASANGENPQWCHMNEQTRSDGERRSRDSYSALFSCRSQRSCASELPCSDGCTWGL